MIKCTESKSGDHEHCEDLKDSRGDEVVVCHDCKKTLGKVCEVWARPCGYLRPTSGFNPGKKAEFTARKNYEFQT